MAAVIASVAVFGHTPCPAAQQPSSLVSVVSPIDVGVIVTHSFISTFVSPPGGRAPEGGVIAQQDNLSSREWKKVEV